MITSYLVGQFNNPNIMEILFVCVSVIFFAITSIFDLRRFKPKTKSARNEVKKLKAAFINALSLGILAVSAIGPATTGVFYPHTYFNYTIRDGYALMFTGFLVGLLQSYAWWKLRDLED